MDIKRLILDKIEQKQTITAAQVVKTTGFSRAYVNRFFKQLRDEGRIVLLGNANRARYVLANKKAIEKEKKNILSFNTILENRDLSEDLVLDNVKKTTGIFIGLRENVAHIVDYAFTEMLNNAIDHSKSKIIDVDVRRDDVSVTFSIADKGVGIFKKIMKEKKLTNELESAQELLKGKQTTDPTRHSGEGIFFTSKAADVLIIESDKKRLRFDNVIDDTFIEDINFLPGTRVKFAIAVDSRRQLTDVFRAYSDKSFEFIRTKVVVKLFQLGTNFISRSEARRIMEGLEKFSEIILDFKGVETVGQGFADEVFRVWQKNNPDKKIKIVNANENINFMVKRANT